MPVYQSSTQLYHTLELLFQRIGQEESGADKAVLDTRLIFKLHCKEPQAEVLINARKNPLRIDYGPSNTRADIEVTLPADTLHQILLAQLPLREALGSGKLRLRGSIKKSFALESIFHAGQTLYPAILDELGINY